MPNQECEGFCIYMLGGIVLILFVGFFRLDFRTVSTVVFFVFQFIIPWKILNVFVFIFVWLFEI